MFLSTSFKRMLITAFLSISFTSVCAQDYYFTNASSGLVVRQQPTVDSERIGKLVYGSLSEIIEETNIPYHFEEDGKTRKSTWVKVKYHSNTYSTPFLEINEVRFRSQRNKTGYVLKYYLHKLERASITIKKIDKEKFLASYKEPVKTKREKITSFEETKKLLSDRVKWKWINPSKTEKTIILDKIILPNGQTLRLDEGAVEQQPFVAYFPTEEILLFEAGHTSDFSISTKTGESLLTVGNPKYLIDSPTGKHRLNGWFPGHECSSYFFQEKTENGYKYLVEFNFDKTKTDEDLCYFNKFSWLDDDSFIFSITDFYMENEKIEKYFLGKLKY